MATIEFTNVTKIYRIGFLAKKVIGVENLSFSVEADTISGFVGPNGAGKTTTIKLLLGLIRPNSGQIKINGKPSIDPASRKTVSFLPEQPYFYEHLTVKESLELIGKIQGIDMHGNREIERVLDEVGLKMLLRQKVKSLSKGMQQRLSMAMALLGESNIYVFDEPMSGLDPLGRRLFRNIIRTLGQRHKCVLFSTHSLEDITELCDSIIVLSRGQLQYQGAVSALLEKGFEGTDITVVELPVELKRRLLSLGCKIVESKQNIISIFVPSTLDAKECQKMLFENGIHIISITPRNKSLEDILYNDNQTSANL